MAPCTPQRSMHHASIFSDAVKDNLIPPWPNLESSLRCFTSDACLERKGGVHVECAWGLDSIACQPDSTCMVHRTHDRQPQWHPCTDSECGTVKGHSSPSSFQLITPTLKLFRSWVILADELPRNSCFLHREHMQALLQVAYLSRCNLRLLQHTGSHRDMEGQSIICPVFRLWALSMAGKGLET